MKALVQVIKNVTVNVEVTITRRNIVTVVTVLLVVVERVIITFIRIEERERAIHTMRLMIGREVAIY